MQTQALVKVQPTVVDGIRFYVAPDGSEVGISMDGLARLSGVEHITVQALLGLRKTNGNRVAAWLEHLSNELFSNKIQGSNGAKVVTSKAAAEVIIHYADDSKVATNIAKRSVQQFMALGMDSWIKSQIKKATASRETIVAHLDNVFRNSPDAPLKDVETVAEEVTAVEILDTVKQLTERIEELQKTLHKMSEQPQSNRQPQQNKEPVQQEEKYYTVKEYLSSKGLVMSVQDLSRYACAVCKEYRSINNKRPQRVRSHGSRAYSAADFPLLDKVLAKHLGL